MTIVGAMGLLAAVLRRETSPMAGKRDCERHVTCPTYPR